jgi:tetratricopeptide (TPR) repeat protein
LASLFISSRSACFGVATVATITDPRDPVISPFKISTYQEAFDYVRPERDPQIAAAWVAYHCHRDYDRALAEVAIARPRLPNDPWVFGLPGFIARRQGQFKQCVINLERAAELDPRSLWLLEQNAQTYWLLRRFPDMARFLDRAIAIAPSDSDARVTRALVDLEARADTQPADEAIQKILIEDPSSVEAVAEEENRVREFISCKRVK